jgi:hypothetical protein
MIRNNDFCLKYNLFCFSVIIKSLLLIQLWQTCKILVVLWIRYTKIPFFLKGKERKKEGWECFSVFGKTQPYYFTSICCCHWQDKWINGKQHQQQHSLGNFVCGRIMFFVFYQRKNWYSTNQTTIIMPLL